MAAEIKVAQMRLGRVVAVLGAGGPVLDRLRRILGRRGRGCGAEPGRRAKRYTATVRMSTD